MEINKNITKLKVKKAKHLGPINRKIQVITK